MLGELLEEMLKKLDQQMSDVNDLRAVDLFNAYYGGFDALKLFVGRAEGITGFSEVLIFRAIYHFLGGDFERVLDNKNGVKWGDKYRFVKDSLTLAKSPTLQCDGRKYSPDIVIFRNNTPSTVIEIKIYPVQGHQTIKDVVERLSRLYGCFPNLKGCLIIYDCGGGTRELINEYDQSLSWFFPLVLKDNPVLFQTFLQELL